MKNIIIGILAVFLALNTVVQGQTKSVKPAYCPIAVKRPFPQMPEIARRACIEGAVELSLLVDENGNVNQVKIVRSTAELFDTACINAAKQWKFKPGKIADSKGDYVTSKFWYPLTFDLNNMTGRRDFIRIY